MSLARPNSGLLPLLWLSAFALAMALIEAAIVVYLRAFYYADHPLQIFPLRLLSENHLLLELARETATIVMLLAVAALAGRTWSRRFATFVFLFGLWDLGYYGWLKLFLGWPTDWLEWDLLFLIPWPWLGPWIAPALIASLFVAWGGWVLLAERDPVFNYWSAGIFCAGALLALAAFLEPAWPQLLAGREAAVGFVPERFAWEFYAAGTLAMAVGLWQSARARG